jgi:hypothetical protein
MALIVFIYDKGRISEFEIERKSLDEKEKEFGFNEHRLNTTRHDSTILIGMVTKENLHKLIPGVSLEDDENIIERGISACSDVYHNQESKLK